MKGRSGRRSKEDNSQSLAKESGESEKKSKAVTLQVKISIKANYLGNFWSFLACCQLLHLSSVFQKQGHHPDPVSVILKDFTCLPVK